MRGAQLPRIHECRDCHNPIRFVTMPTGRRLPVNPKPGNTGTVAARLAGHDLQGYVISTDHPADPRYPLRFRPHFASCEARDHTTHPAPTETPADPALF